MGREVSGLVPYRQSTWPDAASSFVTVKPVPAQYTAVEPLRTQPDSR